MQNRYTIPKPPHGSQNWLNARWKNEDGLARITASVAAVVHNEHRFTTPADLAVELLAKTPPVPKEQNDAMRRGTILEGPLMLWASEILNATITEPQDLYCYEEDGVRLMATLDGKDLSGKIYELKTYNKRWNGQLPPYWKWQGVQQAICADANEIIWIVFDSDLQLQFHTQTVTSDERQQHIDAVRKFLGFIDMGMMPEGADPTYDNASALYPEGYENTVVLGHEIYNTLERLSIAKGQIMDEKQLVKLLLEIDDYCDVVLRESGDLVAHAETLNTMVNELFLKINPLDSSGVDSETWSEFRKQTINYIEQGSK
jgi:hypothetical protein